MAMHRQHLRQVLQACLLIPDLSTVLEDLHQLLAMGVRLKDVLEQTLQHLQALESARHRPAEVSAVEQALDAAQASADLAAAEGLEPDGQVAAAASAAADAAAALNVPIGAQLSIAAVAAAKIAIDLGISQDDAADAAASCTESITQSMGQDADTRAQAADTTAIITGYLVASHAGEGPIAAGLEAGKAMRAAGSTPQEQLSAAADAALHAASTANLPKELQLVAATAAIGRTAAVGRIRTSKDEFRKLILHLAAQLAVALPSYGVDEATLATTAEAAAVQDLSDSIQPEIENEESQEMLISEMQNDLKLRKALDASDQQVAAIRSDFQRGMRSLLTVLRNSVALGTPQVMSLCAYLNFSGFYSDQF